MTRKAIALALTLTASILTSTSFAQAASECPATGSLAGWGANSTGYFTIAPGGTCLFPIRIEGAIKDSNVSQQPAHGTLKKLNASTYQYTAKAGYKGKDAFAIRATGQGPTTSGTSVVTMDVTVQ